MSVEYAQVRVQFGRPIGSFQTIKQNRADMLLKAVPRVLVGPSATFLGMQLELCFTLGQHRLLGEISSPRGSRSDRSRVADTRRAGMRARRLLLIGSSGYVGSFLNSALSGTGTEVQTCDRRSGSSGSPDFLTPYEKLRTEDLAQFDVILWFAGHSSVGMALADPRGAIQNNLFNLVGLVEKLSEQQTLIYASTASVYSKPGLFVRMPPDLSDEESYLARSTNAYDASKLAFDILAQSFFPNAIGLRLGTVCGWSPVLRDELVFNRMCLEGGSKGVVEVRNASAWRSLLFLDDLVSFVVALLDRHDRDDLYNVASYSVSIGELGRSVSEALGCRLDQLPDSETYSFALDTRRARAFWSPRNVGLEVRVHEFLRDCEQA